MTFDLKEIVNRYQGKQHQLFGNFINTQLARVLKTIGFDKNYVKGEGVYLYDSNGDKYLDFLAGYGVFALGRNHPKIKDAIRQALDLDLPNMVQMDSPLLAGVLAEKLVNLIGGRVEMIFWTNSGTEANEGAIKFARKATQKPRILFWDHAFHGLTTGSLALNGNNEFKKGFGPLLPGATMIPFNDLTALNHELSKGDVAAFIFEPVQGKGVNIPDPNFYKEAERVCRKYGALLIADEVQTGFGRTGKMFAHHHWEIEPDIVTVAKALSGGFVPIGAIAYSRNIYKKVFSNMEECVVHSNTFGRNTLAMAAGLATLDLIEEEGIVEHAASIGYKIRMGLTQMANRFELIKAVRGEGLMIAIEFGSPKSLKLKASWMMLQAAKKGLFAQMVVIPLMKNYKILTQVAGHNINVVKILPPLIITDEHADYFLKSFEEVMIECHKMPGTAWKVGKDLAVAAMSSSKMPAYEPQGM
ncbi:MAG: aspartate aminotransferase family protein [Pseudomonadota bacterium]